MRKKKRSKSVPDKFQPGFIKKMDSRLKLTRRLNRTYRSICDDLGGEDTLSHTVRLLVERMIFLSSRLKAWEAEIAATPEDSERLLSRWIQGLNSFQGLAKTIGLKRKQPKDTLKAYVEGKQRRRA